MYQIAYFQKELKDLTTPSFIKFKNLIINNKAYQPIIFCDTYNVEFANIPIFHSSYINQHFYKQIILTDFDHIDYILNFKNYNFCIVYNKLVQTPTDNRYKYIDLDDDLENFLKENYYEYQKI